MAINVNQNAQTDVIAFTVTVLLRADAVENSTAAACDYISEMLSGNSEIADWAYTYDGYPKPATLPKDYSEGDYEGFRLIDNTEGRS